MPSSSKPGRIELENGLYRELLHKLKGQDKYTDKDPTADALRRLWDEEDEIEQEPEGPVRLQLGNGHD